MIVGAVNENREAVIRFEVLDADGQRHDIDAVVDTGYNGALTLQASVISSLRLTWLGREQGLLADGVTALFDIYSACVMWDNQQRIVETAAADGDPLVGMAMLEGCELRVQVIANGQVVIEAIEP